jgi:ABC-2 type transport system permease protein
MFIFGLAFGPSSTSVSTEEEVWTHVGVFFSEAFGSDFQDRFADICESYKIKLFATHSLESLSEGVIKGNSGIKYGIAFNGDPQNIQLTTYLDVDRQNSNAMYTSTVSSLAEDLKTKEANFKEILNVEVRNVDFSEKPVTTLGYLLAGVLSISITFSGLSALIISLGYFRKQNVIRRFLATPLKGSAFLIADIINNIIFSFLSLIIIFIVSVLVFRIQFNVNIPYLLLTFISSMFFMMALGGFFLVLFRGPKAALNVANLFSNILVFFSGVYFPLELLPEWLRNVAFFFPMTYVARSMRFALGQDFIPLSEFYLSNFIFLGIGIVTIPLLGYAIFNKERE